MDKAQKNHRFVHTMVLKLGCGFHLVVIFLSVALKLLVVKLEEVYSH